MAFNRRSFLKLFGLAPIPISALKAAESVIPVTPVLTGGLTDVELALLNGPPSQLDTLMEISEALNNDAYSADFANTVLSFNRAAVTAVGGELSKARLIDTSLPNTMDGGNRND